MLQELVSDFVKEAPPYNFGVGARKPPLRPGVHSVIDLHKNENLYGISSLAEKEMRKQSGLSNIYPDISASSLTQKLAIMHQVQLENVLVTQGATSALGFIGDVFIRKGDEVIITSPTYPNYYNISKKNCGIIVEVPMDEDLIPNFEKIRKAVTSKTKIVFLCNPNNPTGTICRYEELIDFLKELPSHVVLVVDEAYFDFIDEPGYNSLIENVGDDVNLIVVRTFSKIYGMAGARIGYVVSNKEIIGYLRISATGFCCNRVGLLGAEAALDDEEFVESTKRRNKEGRNYLTEEMKTLGFKVWPSHSNFIFFDPGIETSQFAEEMYSFGINLRGDFSCCRISVGRMEHNKRAVEAMKAIVKGSAV